jgi:hypothetical protein
MAQRLLDFSDIVARVREELQVSTNDTTLIDRIEREINIVYEHEVVPFKRWKWLEGHTDVIHKAYYAGGTCSVTPDSTTVTLSTAPGATQGSFAGFLFSVDGFDEIYEIASHTAQSTTVTLASSYQAASASTAATFKIWRDKINLPTDCRETVDVWHNRQQRVMEASGRQELRQRVAKYPKVEGFPQYYSTIDFIDPTSGTDETESDRYRQARIYPSLTTENVTLHVDYVKEVDAMVDDADEPVLPREDRMVLVYGALSKLWDSIRRNPEMAAKNQSLYDRKLAQMAGRIEDSFDTPQLRPAIGYVRAQRGRLGRKAFNDSYSSGSSGLGNITYLQDVTINGMTLTANMTVSSGITIDGRDISADGTLLDTAVADLAGIDTANRVVITTAGAVLDESAITSTELTYLDDVTVLTSATLTDNSSGTVTSFSAASFDTIFILYSIKRGSAYESGIITMMTDASSASIAQGAIASIGSSGVTLSAAYSGGNLQLNYATTSTGNNAIFKYKAQKWLS